MQARPHLSIVIPAYNEAIRIVESLKRLLAFLTDAHGARPFEVLVVDDGSTDGTVAAVEDFVAGLPHPSPGVRVILNGRNRGKGYSIKHGVLTASGEYLLLSDADFSTPIEELPRLLGPVESRVCAIAIGSRSLDESRVEVRQALWRQTMGRCFNRLVRGWTGLPYRDTQCGFKVMRRDAVLPLFRVARVERFAYDVELLYLARKTGLAVMEVPVLWRNAPGSKVNALFDSFDMLKDIVRLVLRDRRGAYAGLARTRKEIGGPEGDAVGPGGRKS